jgi:hypothetical protein
MADSDRPTQVSPRPDVQRNDPVVITDPSYEAETPEPPLVENRPRHRSEDPHLVEEHRILPAKTSTMAVFALVVGLTALYAFLTVVLAPLALVLSIVGLLLGIGGVRRAREQGVTGKGVAISGIVLSVIALVGSIVLAAGVTTFLNDDAAVQRLENRVQDLRDGLPRDVEIPQP